MKESTANTLNEDTHIQKTIEILLKSKKEKKTATVYLPEDGEEAVRESNVTKPFETTAMKQEDFLDWKGFVNKRYKMATKDQEGK